MSNPQDQPAAGGGFAGSSFQAGAYYPLAQGSPTSTGALTAFNGQEAAFPFLVGASVTPAAFGYNVTSAGSAGAIIRLGIRNDNGGVPGSLVRDLGFGAATAVGEQDLAVAGLTLAPGLYWASSTLQGAPATGPTLSGVPSSSYPILLGWLGDATAPTWLQFISGCSQPGVTGALPNTFAPHPVGAAEMALIGMRT